MHDFDDFNFDLDLTQQMSASDKLAETAATIALENFQWRYITLLFFNSTFLYAVNNFLKFYDKSVISSRGLEEPRHAENTRQYVIFGRDIEHIMYMLDWMQLYNFDNTGRFIVICESDDCDESEAIETFWYHKIINVIFLKYFSEEVHGYIYFFSGENCAMSMPVKINMDSCLQNVTTCLLYPEKFTNLYKCPLIASTFLQPPYMMNINSGKPIGADGSLLQILADTLNATLKIMTPNRGDAWGALGKDGTWIGSLGDIYYDLANISMTSAALTLTRFLSFQLSYNYNFVVIGWICNPTELESASLKLLHPFSKLTHIAVAFTFMLVIVYSFFISSRLWQKFKRRLGVASGKKNNVVFYSWMICMGLASPQLPRKPMLLCMVFIWIWYTFLVRTMYQASLINSLKTNVYMTSVETVEDMMKNKYKFGGGTALRDYYINYPKVYDNFIGMNFSELVRLAKKITRGEKIALAVNLEAVTSLYFTHGEPFHILKERIVVSPTAIFFKKFSPLAESVNNNLLRLVESGITDKLYRKYIIELMKQPTISENEGPMTMEHFTGCYAILFAGWTVSILFFICEMCCGYRNKV